MQHEVGSVLWVIHTATPGLMAYQVVEEITKKTLSGEETQYIVRPAVAKKKLIKLNSIEGRIFKSAEEAQLALMENAESAIQKMIDKTKNNIQAIFFEGTVKPTQTVTAVQKNQASTPDLPVGYQWVKMDDGTKIKMKIPEELL